VVLHALLCLLPALALAAALLARRYPGERLLLGPHGAGWRARRPRSSSRVRPRGRLVVAVAGGEL